ncbi:unnamed protein product [Adineta ricciae]|uniref:Ionotropic glutamate receptor C-terminal domain-containing protein n=1 Tax=Adineta ricciae TaxID=249248 RepID=A0A813QGX2_ADIRI|nr:unnamed protein product [Adineta ricciae]CAF1283702.1 unnamed protein product [Adineta ricciae]
MLSLWLRILLVIQVLSQPSDTIWPSSNLSNIRLIGLFPDQYNSSKTTSLSVHSRAMFQAAVTLAQQSNMTVEGKSIGYESFLTNGDGIYALADTCRALNDSNIVGVIGPGYSRESHIISPFADKLGFPVVSYASTDPSLSDRKGYPAFYRTVPSDNIAAVTIAKLFVRFNWTRCIIIYQNDAFGSGGMSAISDAFDKYNLTVSDTIVFDIAAQSVRGSLKAILTKNSARIIILWAIDVYATIVLNNALRADVLGPQFTWILSANIRWNEFDSVYYPNLNGMLVVEPVVASVVSAPINDTLLNLAYSLWQEYEPETFPGAVNVDYYALFAFDAAWLLIKSLQQLCLTSTVDYSPCIQYTGDDFCFDRRLINSTALFNIVNSMKYLGVSGAIQFASDTTDRIDGIYYVMKNIQLFTKGIDAVPVMVWSYENDWTLYSSTSVIVWPGNSLTTPTGYASLSGVNLRIAVIETAPFTMITQSTDASGVTRNKLIGYMPDLIELLRVRMGFIPNITLTVNRTFNQVIDAVARDEFDIFVAQTTITALRTQKVGFSDSIFDNSLRVIIRKDLNPNISLFSYLTPFSIKLWFTLLAACIYAGFLFGLIEREINPALRNKSIFSQIGLSLWYSSGTIVGYGVDFHATTAAGRVVTIALYILSLVLVAAYTANLASDLTIAKSKDIIDGVDDIKNGRLAFSRIGILVGSSLEEYYLREISGGIKNYYPIMLKQEIYDGLLNNVIDASIMDSGVLEYVTNNIYCNLTLVGKDFEPSAFGIVFQKNWQYEQILDINILGLREAGTLEDLRKKWFEATYCSQIGETSQAMSIESMVGLFITFGVISTIGLIAFLWKKRFVIRNFIVKLKEREKSSSRESIKISRDDITAPEVVIKVPLDEDITMTEDEPASK